jgi:hypothetical protein
VLVILPYLIEGTTMTCRTIRLILTPALSVLVVPFASGAPPAKLPRTDVLWHGGIPDGEQAFRQGLQEQGCIEERTRLVEFHVIEWHFKRASALAVTLEPMGPRGRGFMSKRIRANLPDTSGFLPRSSRPLGLQKS